jgi:hypothetical protein
VFTARDSRTVTSLAEFALDSLPAMRRGDGAFCFERRVGNSEPLGRSARYTLMVQLGVMRAQAAGYALPFDPDGLDAVSWDALDGGSLGPGDIGLMLWVDARRGGGCGATLADRLDASLAATGGLKSRLGMELGWIVTGLAHHMAAGGSRTGATVLSKALDQLLIHNSTPSGLFLHSGEDVWRRRFPNFATQIYSVLALATVARYGLDDRALPAAIAAADLLLELQLHDGGWPWLFDAERGTVVERYEIYSVHQDAMAPMALLELWEVCRDQRYIAAVARSLAWIYGSNELGADMIDYDNGLVLRSIRRKRVQSRLWAGAKTAASFAGLSAGGASALLTETNATDRPYHFGWVLEAWCGRESSLDGDAAVEFDHSSLPRGQRRPISAPDDTTAVSYAVVTPARNERDNLRRLADSILAQKHAPTTWVIVDDGSDDGTRESADDLALQHDWILVVGTGDDAADLAMGRRQGRDLLAFRRGLDSLPCPTDVFVKVDADTSFDADYFARLMDRFAQQPELGIAGGTCYELLNGEWVRIKVSGAHPRGASRAYRWALLDDVFALEPELGWDGIDEVMAELRGYRTVGFTDFGFRHHRKVGEREGRLRAGAAEGLGAWYMGYRPSYQVLRACYRAREDPAALAMIWGYVSAAASGAPQCRNPTIIHRIREGQRLRFVIRRRGWD